MLSHYGYDVTIFAAGFNHSTHIEERLKDKEFYRVEVIQGVRFLWIKTPSYSGNDWRRMYNMITYAALAYRYSSVLKQRPDIIFSSNPHLFSGLTGYFLAKKYRAHFVFEVRDLWPQVFVDIGAFPSEHPLILFLRIIEKFIYNKAKKIIVLMPKAFEYIESQGADPKKILYLPHALDVEVFGKKKEKVPPALEEVNRLEMKGKLIVGYLGAHGIADALDTLLDCCMILQQRARDNVHFVLVGHGSEKKRLLERANELKLSNITFFQAIPKKNVPSVIKLFDVAIVCKKDSPLYKYGTSFIKTFDYMACGVPILWAVNSLDCPVTEAMCGIAIPAEQPYLMADAVTKFTDMSSETRTSMGLNGLDYVKQNHDNKILCARLRSILESL